jgi:hypothetical protein
MPSSFLRGAIVSFSPTLGVPIPNVIVFQFNPETISHSWSQAELVGRDRGKAGGDPLAANGYPPESFSFTLSMNADSDAPSNPAVDAIAKVSGIYSRIAALEMLLNPTGNDAIGALVGAVSSALSGGSGKLKAKVPLKQVPTALFVWGIGRIVPVRVTSLQITEKLYDVALNPTYAEAAISLDVLTPQDLGDVKGPLGTVALAAYDYTLALRQALAIANLANSATSIIGMIP